MRLVSFVLDKIGINQSFCNAGARGLGLASLLILFLVGVGFAQSVQPIDWSRYAGMTGVQPGDAFGQSIVNVMNNQTRYLYNWVQTTYPVDGFKYFNEVPGYYLSTDYGTLRPLAHYALGNAVMIKTGAYDPAITGVSQSQALLSTEMAIRGVAMTHRANRPDTTGFVWGQGLSHSKSWQAAYWAAHDAEAAWMVWDNISSETKTAVTNMVRYEANAFINYTVPYWRSKTGTENYPGDTKAEENAWNSRVLAVAQAMLPGDPNVTAWRTKASELMVSSYARQSDVTNTALVDGQQVQQWLGGYNTFNDGVVVNHSLAHPGYMACHNLTSETMIDASLAGQLVPQSAFFNDQVTWDSFTKLNFVPGTNPYGATVNVLSPGGTILHKKADGTPDPVPYFPNGDDWTLNPAADVNFVLLNAFAEARNLDAGQSVAASTWASVEVNALRALQTRPGHNGNLYQTGDWTDDPAREDVDAYRELSDAWLVHWLGQNSQLSPISDHWGTVPTNFVWTNAAGGSWQTAGNWSANAVLDMAGKVAEFSNPLGASATVNLDADATVGKLLFNSAGGYKIVGPATLTLSAGGLGTNQIEVDAGNHEIAVAVVMNGSTEIDVVAGQLLTMSGPVGGTGDFSKTGGGKLVLTQDILYSGNTTVSAGEMVMANFNAATSSTAILRVTDDARLTAGSIRVNTLAIGGTTMAAVPEPSTIVLALTAGWGWFATRRTGRRRKA